MNCNQSCNNRGLPLSFASENILHIIIKNSWLPYKLTVSLSDLKVDGLFKKNKTNGCWISLILDNLKLEWVKKKNPNIPKGEGQTKGSASVEWSKCREGWGSGSGSVDHAQLYSEPPTAYCKHLLSQYAMLNSTLRVLVVWGVKRIYCSTWGQNEFFVNHHAAAAAWHPLAALQALFKTCCHFKTNA